MSKVWYGNLSNRLEEGKNFSGHEISIGDDITMYYYSDRTCYYVTEIVSRKPLKIKVRRWYTCADHSKAGGMGHQDWMYFKTLDAMNKYLSGFFPESYNADEHREEPEASTWVFRYNKWMEEIRINRMPYPEDCTKREREHFEKYGWYNHYHDLPGRVSFGVRNYHYDWEF